MKKTGPVIRGLFGTGRSGSSWLGSIIDSHPKVAYRFEPFQRLIDEPEIADLRNRLECEACDNGDLARAYDILLPANSAIERPPFFKKSDGPTIGKTWARPLARKFPLMERAYRACYTTRARPVIVFKEVNMEKMMANLLLHTPMRVVYLVRHPCAVVSSMISGIKRGVMPIGRQSVLLDLFNSHDPMVAEQYGSQLDRFSVAEKEALLWRFDVERGIAAAASSGKALIVIYELLCDDPELISRQVFNHFGLEFSEQTASYLEYFTNGVKMKSKRLSEFGIMPYFSVRRNPAATKDKWKEKLTPEEQKKILALVQDSVAFQFCASQGDW